MGQLRLPEGAEGAFRIEWYDVFGRAFTINVYGADRDGWFVASLRGFGTDRDSGIRQLPRGEWRTLLHLTDHDGFWGLPEDGAHLEPPRGRRVSDDHRA